MTEVEKYVEATDAVDVLNNALRPLAWGAEHTFQTLTLQL